MVKSIQSPASFLVLHIPHNPIFTSFIIVDIVDAHKEPSTSSFIITCFVPALPSLIFHLVILSFFYIYLVQSLSVAIQVSENEVVFRGCSLIGFGCWDC